jgi:predicted Zn-dependent protease with MMP-like domain
VGAQRRIRGELSLPITPSITPTYDTDGGGAISLTRREFERIVDQVLEELPGDIAAKLDNLVVVVEERPPPGEDLLGLYEGISLADRGMDYAGVLPDRITIYMESHIEMELDRVGTIEEIRRTVLHEIGHHLGIDDARLSELGWV